MKKYIWKVWLRLNTLTRGVINDYFAVVSTTGNTVKNSDIARKIVENGSEIKYDTILHILNQSDQIIRESIQEGYSVQTGYCHITPRVQGHWLGAITHYTSEKHNLTVDMNPTIEMRDALKEVDIEVLGIKDGGSYIGLVTDVTTGKTDGKVTIDGDIIIEGSKIKILTGDDKSVGLFFVAEDGNEFPVTHQLAINSPKKIVARVPHLKPGLSYTLKIITQYTSGNQLLKTPRTIIYNTPLIVE
jgi:hypothetical protein